MSAPVYLDHNATTPVAPEVFEAMRPWLTERFGNPSSGHAFGRPAKAALQAARGEVAALLGASPDELVFTSGGTEANNLAIFGALEESARRGIVTSALEHPATAAPCARLSRQGCTVTRLPCDAQGRVVLPAALDGSVALATLIHAHNETGVLQPVAALAELAHAAGALVHADAAQSCGKVPVRVDELRVDLLSVAGHKLGAPKGVGALYVRRGTRLAPLLLGAGQERGLRPGTENVAFAVGLGAACTLAGRTLEAEARRLTRLRDALHARLAAQVPGLVVNGGGAERLPNTLSVRFPGCLGRALLEAAPEVAASTGSACHAGHDEPPAAIVALGVPPTEALGTVRLTLGRGTDEAQVEQAAAALVRAFRASRA